MTLATHSHRNRLLWRLGALLVAFAIAVTLVSTGTSAVATPDAQQIVNGNFSLGTSGWQVDGVKRSAFSVKHVGRSGSKGAVLVLGERTRAALTPVKAVVASPPAGANYSVAGWVRASRRGTVAELRVEQSSGAVSSRRFVLNDRKWHKLSLSVKAQSSDSVMRLGYFFSATAPGQTVYVDDVSFFGPSPQEPGSVVEPSTPPGECVRPGPAAGTQFGSSISTSSTIHGPQAIADRDAIFGTIPVVRIWDDPMPFSWSDPRTVALRGRTIVISFRPDPVDVLSGKLDAQLRKWFETAPSTSRIYWSYYHEPETPIDGEKAFTAEAYRRAWQHIDRIADSVCRQNMYSTLVLMGWTADPRSNKDWRTYYPGAGVIDVLAFDPYNGVHDPQRDYYASPASMFDSLVSVAREAGKPYGIAEIGSRRIPSDATGAGRAEWLTEVAAYSRQHGALFVTYFQSARDGEWRLLDQPSQHAWRAAVESSSH